MMLQFGESKFEQRSKDFDKWEEVVRKMMAVDGDKYLAYFIQVYLQIWNQPYQ